MRIKSECAFIVISLLFLFLPKESFAQTADLNISYNAVAANVEEIPNAVRGQIAAILKLGTQAGVRNFYLTHIGYTVTPQRATHGDFYNVSGYVILAFTPEN